MAEYKSPGVYVEQVPSGSAPIAGVGTSTAGFVGVMPNSWEIPNTAYDSKITDANDPRSNEKVNFTPAAAGKVVLVTNFTEFKNAFGDFWDSNTHPGQSMLAHAVYGFFQNGGTRCYITRIAQADGKNWYDTDISKALELFEPIDEIAIVAAPGLWGAVPQGNLKVHCELNMNTCVAIADTQEYASQSAALEDLQAEKLSASDSMALYFPWIQVYDPATKGPKFVPPSGHVAGVYARVDARRGVHKAPANEKILGIQGVKYAISRAQQDGLNPQGVNCIRWMNGDYKIWGARTMGGDQNLEFKYVNVRRLFNYLRASIDAGTQWAVFEPNNPDLWAKITRNVSAFLSTVWSSGALFGDKAEDAFYVKCDAETNPPALRDKGQVVTEIGVAITRPAEFVIFRLGQKASA